jgi:hypothetical protein
MRRQGVEVIPLPAAMVGTARRGEVLLKKFAQAGNVLVFQRLRGLPHVIEIYQAPLAVLLLDPFLVRSLGLFLRFPGPLLLRGLLPCDDTVDRGDGHQGK